MALGATEGRTEQSRVESVRHGRAATAAMLFKCDAVPGAATCADASMHHAVIRQRHARCVARGVLIGVTNRGADSFMDQYLTHARQARSYEVTGLLRSIRS